jgi:hypothetical protein
MCQFVAWKFGVVVELALGTLAPVGTNDARVIALILSIFVWPVEIVGIGFVQVVVSCLFGGILFG